MRQWEQTAVSAFLRYETYDPAMLANVPGFVRLHAMASPDMEDAVLESVVSLYHEGIAQRVRTDLRLLCALVAAARAGSAK